MKTTKGYTLLLYKKEDIELTQKVGKIFLVNNTNAPQYLCSTATVIDSHHPEIKKGDEAIVSYRIGWDKDINDTTQRKTNAYFIQTDDEGNDIRYCVDTDIFGVIRNGQIYPKKEYLFCELPELIEEKTKGGIIIPDAFREQKTDNIGYWTRVKYAHPKHTEELGLEIGDRVYAEKNSDIMKEIKGVKMLCVPIQKVLGCEKSNNLATA